MKKILFSLTTLLFLAGNGMADQTVKNEPVNTFTEIQKLQQQMDQLFNRLHQQFLNDTTFAGFQDSFSRTPATDIVDKGDHYLIKADIPGADEKSIKVTEKNGMLTIEAKSEKEKREKGENFIRQERFAGAFVKMMTLPKDADASKLKTEYKNGVLKITIPKQK